MTDLSSTRKGEVIQYIDVSKMKLLRINPVYPSFEINSGTLDMDERKVKYILFYNV